MTSFELMVSLGEYNHELLDETVLNSIDRFLAECDMVKFAKYIPPEQRWSKITVEALDIVDRTTPAPRVSSASQPSIPGGDPGSPVNGDKVPAPEPEGSD